MNKSQLVEQIRSKASYLCVGLDTEKGKLPAAVMGFEDPVFEFNRRIIDATVPFAVSYKLNIAFYEQYGVEGWESLAKTLAYIPTNCFTIADAKRGDIGNTGKMYARTFFETYNFDSVTLAPYMGHDSISPFLEYADKFSIVLGLTSNQGSEDFQMLETPEGKLFEVVMKKVSSWGTPENIMFVVGATKAERFEEIRTILPHHFLLVPGVGAQGGDLQSVSRSGLNAEAGLLVNSSRGILYASSGDDFDIAAAREAQILQQQMQALLLEKGII